MCVSLSACHVCMGCEWRQGGVSDALELEVQTVVSHPVSVLGMELRSSAIVSALKGYTISPDPMPDS